MYTFSTVRLWINQPSTLQPLHNMHGQRVILIRYEDNGDFVQVAPISGNTLTMRVSVLCLSEGWPHFTGE